MREADFEMGCQLPLKDWMWLNRTGCFEDNTLRQHVSPFPPMELIENVSGLTIEKDFASHGADIYISLTEASPKPLAEYQNLLDFGCGCGRLARMFKGHPYKVLGCDIDVRHVDWINKNLNHIKATVSSVNPPLPYADNKFDGIISISVFTHLNEKSQDEFLNELYRVCEPGGHLFLTVSGAKALDRAVNEPKIREMISVEESPFQAARKAFAEGKHAFILQQGHLTSEQKESSFLDKLLKRKVVTQSYEYGITFIPEAYIREHWSQWFNIVDYRHGAIHQFQDIVVLRPKK